MKPDQHFAGLIQEAFEGPSNPLIDEYPDGASIAYEVEHVSIDGFPNKGGRLLVKSLQDGETLYYIDVWRVSH